MGQLQPFLGKPALRSGVEYLDKIPFKSGETSSGQVAEFFKGTLQQSGN